MARSSATEFFVIRSLLHIMGQGYGYLMWWHILR